MRLLTIFVFVPFFFLQGACNLNSPQIERDLKSSIRRLTQMMRDYEQIPESRTQYGRGFVISKDQERLTHFRKQYQDDFKSVDDTLLKVSSTKDNNVLFDDAMFCRAILYSFWSRVDNTPEFTRRTIDVLREFVDQFPTYHIEEATKTALQESFWDKYKDVVTPNLSYEENGRLLFQASVAYLFLKLKDNESATKQYESVIKAYPDSKLAHLAADQIKTIRELQRGEIEIPKR